MPSGPYHPCPRCGRVLLATARMVVAGIAVVGLGNAWAFQCDACTEPLDLGDGGDPLDLPLTFAVDDRGQVHAVPGD